MIFYHKNTLTVKTGTFKSLITESSACPVKMYWYISDLLVKKIKHPNQIKNF